MSIFKQMHEQRIFNTLREYQELKRMLSEAIERGHVEAFPVLKPSRFLPTEQWFRDKETGEIYRLIEPDEVVRQGSWMNVDPSDLVDPNEPVQ